jgi:hypothetical protein
MGIKKMKIRITQAGETQIQVEGGQGEDCLAFTQAVESAVGKVEHREWNEDYHQDPAQVQIGDTVVESHPL